MVKCLKINIIMTPTEVFLKEVIQKHARKFELEGYCQPVNSNSVKVIICGIKEKVDSFLDILHKEVSKKNIEDIEIEPFVKDKDYRGVFRVVE